MIEVILCRGTPSAGKSTWAKEKVAQDPDNWAIINNDQIRAMLNNGIFSSDYEKMVAKIRINMVATALRYNKNVIIDNVNADKRHFEEVCDLVKNLNIDCVVKEKCFYIELQEAIDRDSKRIGKACVGEKVVTKFWKKLGGKEFETYKPKEEIFHKTIKIQNKVEYNSNLPDVVIGQL
jgi:predicted kinase